MSSAEPSGRVVQVKNAVDFNIVAENVREIAGFAIAKYEFMQGIELDETLCNVATTKIRRAMWRIVESTRSRRMAIWQELLDVADKAYEEYKKSIAD